MLCIFYMFAENTRWKVNNMVQISDIFHGFNLVDTSHMHTPRSKQKIKIHTPNTITIRWVLIPNFPREQHGQEGESLSTRT